VEPFALLAHGLDDHVHVRMGFISVQHQGSALGPAPEPEGAQKVAHLDIAEKRRA
jgi:hypothetical protein